MSRYGGADRAVETCARLALRVAQVIGGVVDADDDTGGRVAVGQGTTGLGAAGHTAGFADLDAAAGEQRQLGPQPRRGAPRVLYLGGVAQQRAAHLDRPPRVEVETDPAGQPAEEV